MESESIPEGDPEQYLLIVFISIMTSGLNTSLLSSILSILLLLCGSALISASEAAFYSLRPGEIDLLKDDDRNSSKRVLSLLENKDLLLSTILIANNLINVAIVITAYFIFSSLLSFEDIVIWSLTIPGVLVAFLINIIAVTSLIVLVGELAPKVYAQQKRMSLVTFMSGPLYFLKKLLWLPNIIINYPVRLMERYTNNSANDLTVEEIHRAIDITAESEVFTEDVGLLKGIVHFGNTTVKQIMVSRLDIEALSIETKFDELLEKIKESGFSRLPVYKGDIDNVEGILYVKDLLQYLGETDNFNWRELIRDPFFVPETKKIDDLLKEIQANRKHQAIVVDEYGGTSGLVTLEDIVEEVLGEIKDEFDEEIGLHFRKIDDNNYIFEGKALLNDVCKFMQIPADSFEEVKGDADSLAGMVLEIAGTFPQESQSVRYGPFQFVVLSIGHNRIEKVKIIRDTSN